VQKYGGEKELTRHTPDENILKCTSTITETKAFENLSKPIDNSLVLYNLPNNSEIEKEIQLNQLNKNITLTQSLVEKPMIKLYDLEKNENPTSSIKIDLDIDLYQMEDY
jgi:hypothetical protein